jgi:hypothetical protein
VGHVRLPTRYRVVFVFWIVPGNKCGLDTHVCYGIFLLILSLSSLLFSYDALRKGNSQGALVVSELIPLVSTAYVEAACGWCGKNSGSAQLEWFAEQIVIAQYGRLHPPCPVELAIGVGCARIL